MQAALGAVAVGPAALAAGARQRGVRVADRGVAAIVQRVVGQPALADVRPAVVVAPVGERVRLPELVRGVPAELRRVRARRRLVAADAGDPGVEAAERADERLDLGDREVEVGLASSRAPRRASRRAARRSGPRTPRPSCRSAARPRARARTSPGRGSACRSRRRAPSARCRRAGRAARSPPSGRSTRARPGRGTARRSSGATSSALIASTVSGSGSVNVLAGVVGPTEQHLLQRVAAQAEPERLERDQFVGRDVAEVDRRAELLDEPRLRRPSTAPRR